MAGGILMKTIKYKSVFAESMAKFVDFKRAGAAAYHSGAKDVASFDQFAFEQELKDPVITDAIAKEYLRSNTRYNRMCVLRQFSAFHHLSYPNSETLLELGIRKQKCVRFIILDDSQVAELMRATDTLNAIVDYAYAMKCLIGLLYCSALRISEALNLNIEDFDQNDATLFVRCGKFRKQRYVPLATSSCVAISNYL